MWLIATLLQLCYMLYWVPVVLVVVAVLLFAVLFLLAVCGALCCVLCGAVLRWASVPRSTVWCGAVLRVVVWCCQALSRVGVWCAVLLLGVLSCAVLVWADSVRVLLYQAAVGCSFCCGAFVARGRVANGGLVRLGLVLFCSV